MSKMGLDRESKKVVRDLVKYFFDHADFPDVEDFEATHEDAWREGVFPRLLRSELIKDEVGKISPLSRRIPLTRPG
jgi:hypothetical protein